MGSRRRTALGLGFALALAGVNAGVICAKAISGTGRADTLVGTNRADVIYGRRPGGKPVFQGTIAADGSASGTYRIVESFVYQDTQYSCDTNVFGWTAKLGA